MKIQGNIQHIYRINPQKECKKEKKLQLTVNGCLREGYF
jgi:hypothetical protein